MTYLQLIRLAIEKCGISGALPTTVVGLSGEFLRVANWVNEAWLELQQSQTLWLWMRDEFELPLVANKQNYLPSDAGLTSFSDWFPDTFRIHDPLVGISDQGFLHEFGHAKFRDTYAFGSQRADKPSCFALRQRAGKPLAFGPIPDKAYTVTGEYRRGATQMTGNDSTPTGLPDEFHMLIVYGAMRLYASYENAPEVLYGSAAMAATMEDRLAEAWLPKLESGEPLA